MLIEYDIKDKPLSKIKQRFHERVVLISEQIKLKTADTATLDDFLHHYFAK